MKFGADIHDLLVRGLLFNSIVGLRNAHRYFGSLRFMDGIPQIDDEHVPVQDFR